MTRPVSSILGCQHPRFSFQIATIVFSNHAQQQTVDNGSVKPAPRIETSHKSFLWTDNKQTHFWSIALFLYRLLRVKNVQYKCIAMETQRTVSFRYWGIELRLHWRGRYVCLGIWEHILGVLQLYISWEGAKKCIVKRIWKLWVRIGWLATRGIRPRPWQSPSPDPGHNPLLLLF